MKKLLSTKYSAGAFSAAMLFIRLVAGILMVNGGYYKLTHFSEMQPTFMNWMGLGTTVSLSLLIFAEFFCSILLIIGLFTRLATIPLIIAMCIVVFQVHKGLVLTEAQLPALYLASYLMILILGPGKVSLDNLISK